MLITLLKKQATELLSNFLGGKTLKEGIFSIRMMIYLLLGFYLFILVLLCSMWDLSSLTRD